MFITDGPRTRVDAAGLGILFLVLGTDGAHGRSLGGVLAEILKSQCACTFAVGKKCTKTLTFENLGLAQFAVCVGQARRFGLACEHVENVRGSSEMSEEALECQCPGIFTVLEH